MKQFNSILFAIKVYNVLNVNAFYNYQSPDFMPYLSGLLSLYLKMRGRIYGGLTVFQETKNGHICTELCMEKIYFKNFFQIGAYLSALRPCHILFGSLSNHKHLCIFESCQIIS